MNRQKNVEIKGIFSMICILFGAFLLIPMIMILQKSFMGNEGFTLEFYKDILGADFLKIFINSVGIAMASAVITTMLAFVLAYSIHFTNIPAPAKKGIHLLAVMPMLLPTITYGFAIIYSLGKQGLLTKLFGRQLFDIYGLKGLMIGYIIYTLPISFLLINNTMGYIDKKFLIVSRVMGDHAGRTFYQTILRPLSGTLAASVIQSFFLSFTDFGIPASVGGRTEVVAGRLYNEMLGSVPNFNKGAVVAMMMLLPSIISILVLSYLEKYNIPNDVLEYIATNVKTNIRELEGSLNKLIALYKLNNTGSIDIALAAEALKDIISSDNRREVTPELILDIVSEHFGVSISDLKGNKRNAEIVFPRQIAMYLIRNMTETSLKAVGVILGGKDHSTIKHGIEKIENELKADETLSNTINIIKKKINPA